MDRRLFLVLGLSLIVALVISSVFYFQVVGRLRAQTGRQRQRSSVADKQLDVGITIKPGDVRLRKVSSRVFPKGAFRQDRRSNGPACRE